VINGPLLGHTWRSHRLRVALIALALGAWGFLMPVIYATFGVQMEAILKSGIIPAAFLRLLGADPFSLSGAVALGSIHPVALGLQLAYPVGFAAVAIAGERQRGTLEVLLSRPISRRSVFITILLAIAGFAVLTTAGQLLGVTIGALAFGVPVGSIPPTSRSWASIPSRCSWRSRPSASPPRHRSTASGRRSPSGSRW
jgi:hypothetical protein